MCVPTKPGGKNSNSARRNAEFSAGWSGLAKDCVRRRSRAQQLAARARAPPDMHVLCVDRLGKAREAAGVKGDVGVERGMHRNSIPNPSAVCAPAPGVVAEHKVSVDVLLHVNAHQGPDVIGVLLCLLAAGDCACADAASQHRHADLLACTCMCMSAGGAAGGSGGREHGACGSRCRSASDDGSWAKCICCCWKRPIRHAGAVEGGRRGRSGCQAHYPDGWVAEGLSPAIRSFITRRSLRLGPTYAWPLRTNSRGRVYSQPVSAPFRASPTVPLVPGTCSRKVQGVDTCFCAALQGLLGGCMVCCCCSPGVPECCPAGSGTLRAALPPQVLRN